MFSSCKEGKHSALTAAQQSTSFLHTLFCVAFDRAGQARLEECATTPDLSYSRPVEELHEQLKEQGARERAKQDSVRIGSTYTFGLDICPIGRVVNCYLYVLGLLKRFPFFRSRMVALNFVWPPSPENSRKEENLFMRG